MKNTINVEREMQFNSNFERFSDLFHQLSAEKDPMKTWEMFVKLTAWEIADAFGNENEKLCKEYWTYYNSLTENDRKIIVEMIGILQIEMINNPFQDFLGEMHAEVLEGYGDEDIFFPVPMGVSELASACVLGDNEAIADRIGSKGFLTISDNFIGSGSMVIGSLKHMDSEGYPYCETVLINGSDSNEVALLESYIQLSLIGAAAILCYGELGEVPEYAVFTPQLFSSGWEVRLNSSLLKDLFNIFNNRELETNRNLH